LSLSLLERAAVAEERSQPVAVIDRVGMCLGMLLRFAGQFAEARRWLLQMRQSADDEGDDGALPNILGHLALLECWAGDYPRALSHVAEGLDVTTRTGIGSPSITAAHALAEAHLGHIDEARRIATAALAHDESQHDLADVACDLRSLGFADLSVDDFSAAAEHFLRALSIAEELGVKEPAILRIYADAVEALIGMGRLAEAERLTEELEATGGADTRWSRAMARRCRGLLLAATGDLSAATAALAAALDDHATLGMPFEEARTRLWMGKVLRRAGRRGEARQALDIAAQAFVELGTPLYADRARLELGRLGGRVADRFTLTPTEMRVADLVGSGHTNHEVAEALFVSVRTVESHLGRIYRKLGLRSRTELARALLPASGVPQ
jgi:DNA-binding CsgD family transcriptional regulator